MTDAVLVSRDTDVATVTLNRPERLNALDKSMWMRLGAAMRELDSDDALRCIVLRGAGGKAFAAGADISEFANERANAAQARRYGEDVAGSMRALTECRHPTVALIEGACVGGGLLIATQCDLRICNASARFGVPVKNLGLTESYDELRGMLRAIGPAASLEILLEGRIWDAREALAKGLVSRVTPDDKVVEEAYAAARRIADGAPLVARWHKKFIRRLADPRPVSAEEHAEGYACFDTEDFRTGYQAFLNKQKPRFTGR